MSLEELEPGNVPKGRRKSLNKRTKTDPEGWFSLCFHDSSHGNRTGSLRGRTLGATDTGGEYPSIFVLALVCHFPIFQSLVSHVS